LNKRFNLLRLVCDNKNYINTYHTELEYIFKELYDYLKCNKNSGFDEDLIMMLTCTMKHLRRASSYTLELLNYVPKLLKKSKGLTMDLFEFLNQLIFYGHEEVLAKEETLSNLYQIYELSATFFMEKSDLDKSPFLGALLMQVLLTVNFYINSNSN